MIPLFRPEVPDPSAWIDQYRYSLSTGMLTNFGPSYEQAVVTLNALCGGYHLPVANGTLAIQIALQVLKKERGMHSLKKVAVPDFTFAATANAVISAGAEPVIIGCRYSDRVMKAELIADNIRMFDAIVAVEPFGYGSYRAVEAIAKANDVPLIWDMAGAWPMFSDDNICCYSLHAAKSLPIGEGGMIRFLTEKQYEIGKQLIAFDFDSQKSALSPYGTNAKMDELHCSVLLAQLMRERVLSAAIDRRRELLRRYEAELEGYCDPIEWPLFPSLCVLRGLPAQAIVEHGQRCDIVFRQYYYPLLSQQPGFKHFRVVGTSEEGLASYVAFPSSVNETEFYDVVNCANQAIHRLKSFAV